MPLPARTFSIRSPLNKPLVPNNAPNESPELKDKRTQAHNVQRTKKTAAELERLKAQARRQQSESESAVRSSPNEHGGRTGTVRKASMPVSEKDRELGEGAVYRLVSGEPNGVYGPAAFAEIQLTELITGPIKLKKGSKSKPTQDFEFIPNVKSVIALDDFSSDEPWISEPWEHVSLEDESDTEVTSYAAVLAGHM